MTAHAYTRGGSYGAPSGPSVTPLPRLPACPRADGLPGLEAWCRWCESWHSHGPGYGHRAAHCHNSESPYAGTGYVLVPAVIEENP